MDNYSALGKNMRILEEEQIFQDLNLDQMIAEVSKEFEDVDLKEYYKEIPVDLETVIYRQQMMQALEDFEIEEKVRAFQLGIRKSKQYKDYASQTQGDGQAHWHLMAACTYFRAVDDLVLFLEEREGLPEGLREFLAMQEKVADTKAYRENHDRAIETYEKMSALRYTLRIEGDCVSVLPTVSEEDYIAELKDKFPCHIDTGDTLPRLLPGSKESTRLEQRLMAYLGKKNPRIFDEMRLFAKECPNFYREEILTFYREISFYLSFLGFRRLMESCGYPFCYPEFSQSGMEVMDGYDLMLAFKKYQEGGNVVANDYCFKKEERFFVVTGPNQGGKTTFGRSTGQLVYLARMGFPVPARRACLPFFDGIVTHFSVEESMESGRGKLQEELVRLATLMHGDYHNVFVIINELFTSAATYDAYRMGQNVMQHFLKRDCYGVFVTHIGEMAKEDGQIVSMTASVEGADNHVRTYKIARHPAEGRGYAETIVEQYGLTYEEIVGRLSHD